MAPPVRHIEAPQVVRVADIRPGSLDEKARTVEVIASTGSMGVRRGLFGDFDEELVVTPEAVDLRRLNTTGAVLDNHRAYGSVRDSVVGAVVPNSARVADGQLVASLRFAQTVAGDEILGMVRDGIIRAVSVGYDPDYEEIPPKKREDGGTRTLLRAVRWEPYEISVVPMGFDPGAVMRSADSSQPTRRYAVRSRAEDMMPEPKPETPIAPAAPVIDQAALQRATEAATSRALDISEAGTRTGADATVVRTLIADHSISVEAAKLRLYEAKEERERARATQGQAPHVTAGKTHEEKQSELIGGAILARAFQGVDPRKIEAHNERVKREGLPAHDAIARVTEPDMLRAARRPMIMLAEQFLESRGVNIQHLGPNEIAGRALAYRSGNGMLGATADFSAILGTAANKLLWAGYAEVQSPWRDLIGVRQDKPDFKAFSIYRRSAAPDLEYVDEHGEVKRSNFYVPTALTGQLKTAGIQVGFTRQMIINDDLGAFATNTLGLGDSARRFQDDVVLAPTTGLLPGNPTLGDNVALFHSSRGNVSADTGTPDLTALGVTAKLFATMTETIRKAGNNAGTTTRKIHQDVGGFLAAFTEAMIINQILMPMRIAPTAATSEVPDFLSGTRAYTEARLGIAGSSPDVWYAFSRNRKAIAYGYLQGETGPRLTEFQAANTDGLILQLLDDSYAAVADPYALVQVPIS